MLQTYRSYILSLLMRTKHLAQVSKKEVEKEIRQLVKSGVISEKEAKSLAKLVMHEISHEKKHFKTIVQKEVKRMMVHAKPIMKKAVKRGVHFAGRVALKATKHVGRRIIKRFSSSYKNRSSKKFTTSRRTKKKTIRKKNRR